MATFPARTHVLEAAVRSLASQVDTLHLVLNEYAEIPGFLARIRNVAPLIPAEDFKDVGKFVPEVSPDDRVFLADDDLFYAPGYCAHLERQADALAVPRAVYGLHAAVLAFEGPGVSRKRRRYHYRRGLRRALRVDVLGTGTLFARGADLPSLDVMRTSRTFVDERLARWCCDEKRPRIAVARPFDLVRPLRPGGPSLYRDVNEAVPPHLADELAHVAGRTADAGTPLGPTLGLAGWLLGGRLPGLR